jgi:GH25 family lysozyme M1 (1,4-beta-N-acetylmuramidase)
MAIHAPFTAADLPKITDAQNVVKMLQDHIKRAAAAGIDVSEHQTKTDAMAKQLAKIRQIYFES